MPCKDSLKRRRDQLFRKDPHCYWCGCEVRNYYDGHHGRVHEDRATLDHLYSRYDPRRGKENGKRVLACWKCNHEREKAETKAQPLERLHELSGRYGRDMEGNCPITQMDGEEE